VISDSDSGWNTIELSAETVTLHDDLWSWQDRDALRLERIGRQDLAKLWYDFDAVLRDTGALRAAAELAKDLDEPWWELFFWHWYVQQSLFRSLGNLQPLEVVAARLRELADDPACSGCPQRFCAKESVCNVCEAADPPGTAQEVLALADAAALVVPEHLECKGCFDLLRIGALIHLGQTREALAEAGRVLARDADPNLRFLAILHRAAALGQLGDAEAMASALGDAHAMVDGEESVNPDNEWYLLELEVRCAVLRDDVDAALRLPQRAKNPPPPTSAEAIRIAIAIAEALAASERHEEALAWADKARSAALNRGFVRLAAEALILGAEICQQTGEPDRAQTHVPSLGNCMAQLTSRDLDDRARRVGASW
jgi:tetratricopeptide (TPR) repeat protein